MIGAGTVINPIIKIVTAVAVLAAVYFFILKPTLDTTEDAFETSFGAFDESFDGFDSLPATIQTQIDDAFENTNATGSLQDCIQRAINAGQDADRIQQRTDRCIDRYAE